MFKNFCQWLILDHCKMKSLMWPSYRSALEGGTKFQMMYLTAVLPWHSWIILYANLIDWSFVILGSYLSFIGMKQIIKKYILSEFITLRNVQLNLCRRYKFTVHCIYILNEWLGDFHQSFRSDLDHYFWLRNVTP